MKSEVGMYVRTNDGYINKIKKVNQFNVLVYGRDLFGEELNIPNNEIVKASYNIIEILKEGDYVNECKVIKNTLKDGGNIVIVQGGNCFTNEEIKTIITHEQMEQMAYKVSD